MSDDLIDEIVRREIERVNVIINQQLIHGAGGFSIMPITFGPTDNEPNGRDQPVEYRDALDIAEDEDLVDDVLESEVLVQMKPRPEDPIDAMLHVEQCEFCARLNNLVKLCEHCLEERVCLRVPIHEPIRVLLSELSAGDVMPRYKYVELCRPCRNSANKGALTLTE